MSFLTRLFPFLSSSLSSPPARRPRLYHTIRSRRYKRRPIIRNTQHNPR